MLELSLESPQVSSRAEGIVHPLQSSCKMVVGVAVPRSPPQCRERWLVETDCLPCSSPRRKHRLAYLIGVDDRVVVAGA